MIEPFDLSMKGYSQDQRLAITHSGLAHLELALSNPIYFEQMALTTRLAHADVAAQIRGAYHAHLTSQERWENVRKIFATYLAEEDSRFGAVPKKPEFNIQAELREAILTQWTGNYVATAVPIEFKVLKGVIATVEKFDASKGFGFARVEELNDDAFLHVRVAEAAGFELHDGDDLLCNVSKNAKGYYISAIHDVVTPKSKSYSGTVVRLFEDRGYGFVDVPELGADAFFHFSIFPRDSQTELTVGMPISFELKTDAMGRHQVRKLS